MEGEKGIIRMINNIDIDVSYLFDAITDNKALIFNHTNIRLLILIK